MLSFGEFLRKREGRGADLQDFGKTFLDEHGAQAFVEMLLKEKRLGGCSSLVIDGVRHQSIWIEIQRRFPESQLCCMDSPTEVLIESLTERENINVGEASRRLEHPVEREFTSLVSRAHHVVRQASADRLIDATLRELISIIDPGIVPGIIRAKLSGSTEASPQEIRNTKRSNLLSDALSKGRRELFKLLLAEGGCIGLVEAADRIGVSVSRLEQMEGANCLLAVHRPGGRDEYPVWQFSDAGILEGLRETLDALSGHNDLARLRFFLNQSLYLGGSTPLEFLREGRVKDVLLAARSYLTHGSA